MIIILCIASDIFRARTLRAVPRTDMQPNEGGGKREQRGSRELGSTATGATIRRLHLQGLPPPHHRAQATL